MHKNGLFCLAQHRMDVIGGMSSVRRGTEAISETVQTIRQTSAGSVAYIKLEGARVLHVTGASIKSIVKTSACAIHRNLQS